MGRSIHQVMEDRIQLAKAYAEDGAFHSAARVLTDLAAEVKEHAVNCDRWLEDQGGAAAALAARPRP